MSAPLSPSRRAELAADIAAKASRLSVGDTDDEAADVLALIRAASELAGSTFDEEFVVEYPYPVPVGGGRTHTLSGSEPGWYVKWFGSEDYCRLQHRVDPGGRIMRRTGWRGASPWVPAGGSA